MPATIDQNQTLLSEIVLSERVATNEYRVAEIQESITNRFVRVQLDLGPFSTITTPNGDTVVRGTSSRGLVVWENDEYDTIRDTWSNTDLLAAIDAKLNV